MNKQKLTECANLAWDGMEHAELLMDCAEGIKYKDIAKCLYNAFWCLYHLTLEIRKQYDK